MRGSSNPSMKSMSRRIWTKYVPQVRAQLATAKPEEAAKPTKSKKADQDEKPGKKAAKKPLKAQQTTMKKMTRMRTTMTMHREEESLPGRR